MRAIVNGFRESIWHAQGPTLGKQINITNYGTNLSNYGPFDIAYISQGVRVINPLETRTTEQLLSENFEKEDILTYDVIFLKKYQVGYFASCRSGTFKTFISKENKSICHS